MDDLISRAEALKALKDMSVTFDAETVQRCIEAVSNLPSAQPEDKCGECDAWNQYKNYPRPTVEAIPIEWLKEHIVTIEQEWILEDWEREHESD